MKNEIKDYYLREIDEELAKWSDNKSNKTIAIINGARRVGKTESLIHLGELKFDKCACIRVDKISERVVSSFLDKENRVDAFKDYLLSNYNIGEQDNEKNILIIFDEIQEHNELKESISFFNEIFNYRFACTGSAQWINDTNGTRPTSDYEQFNLAPFTFKQFLCAIGDGVGLFNDESTLFKTNKDKCIFNKQLMKLFRLYLAIGGMPQSISFFKNHRNDKNVFSSLNKIKHNSIVSTYEKDLLKYTNDFKLPLLNEYRNIIRTLGLKKDVSNYYDTYKKLEDMNIVIYSKDVLEINNKLSLSVNDKIIKPFLLDVGVLFYYLCDSEKEDIVEQTYNDFINGKDSDNNGYLFENYVASSIVQHKLKPFCKFFASFDDEEKKEKEYELDFLTSNKDGPIVIEAKSGTSKEHHSLDAALKKYNKISSSYILGKSYSINKASIKRGPHLIPFYALEFLLGD